MAEIGVLYSGPELDLMRGSRVENKSARIRRVRTESLQDYIVGIVQTGAGTFPRG
jgi:hypothetical protein